MALSALIGSLAVSLGLETAAFRRGSREAQAETRTLQDRLQRAGVAMTASITAPFIALVTQAVPAAREAREAIGQVEAAQRSMGNAAGFSTEQLQAQAAALMAMSTFDDDDILRKVTANLLTFGNVAGQQFERAQRAAVDLSARMGTDLQASTLLVGKALNDPVKGLTALSRAGIQFTAQQKEQIKAMAAAGNAAGAQQIMLAELERQFAGSAQALRNATPGAELKNQWDNFLETLGEMALNVMPPLTDALAGLVSAFNTLSPEMQTVVIGAVAVAAALGPLLLVLAPLVGLVTAAIPAFTGWAAAMTAAWAAAGGWGVLSVMMAALGPILPVLAALAVAIGVAWAAWQNWESLGPMLAALWDSIVATLGPPLQALIAAVVNVLSALWEGPFGDAIRGVVTVLSGLLEAIMATLGPPVQAVIHSLGTIFGTVFGAIKNALNLVAALLRGDFSGAWTALKDLVIGVGRGIVNVVSNMLAGLRDAIKGFLDWAFGKLDDVRRRSEQHREIIRRNPALADPRIHGARTHIINSQNGGGGSIAQSLTASLITPQIALAAAYAKMEQDAARSTGKVINLWEVMAEQTGETSAEMMDRIGARFAALGVQMVDPARAAARETQAAFRDMSSEVHALLARLFPEMQRAADLSRDLALIAGDTAGLSAAQQTEARRRLYLQHGALDPANVTPIDNALVTGIRDAGEATEDLSRIAARANRNVVESFADMARGVLGSLRGMVGAFKGGDILGGLMGLLDMVVNVAGMIGGDIGKRAASFGGFRALGGPVVPGKSYIVGERGPEWFTPSSAGRIVPNNDNGAGMVVRIVPSPYFDAVVDGRAAAVAAPMAGSAAIGGAAMGERAVLRRAARSKP